MTKWEKVVGTNAIDARVTVTLYCPECRFVLLNTDDGLLIRHEVTCSFNGRFFDVPKLPLVEVDRKPVEIHCPTALYSLPESELKDRVLVLLARMRKELDGDGTDLCHHAQGWMLDADKLIPLLEKEWNIDVLMIWDGDE